MTKVFHLAPFLEKNKSVFKAHICGKPDIPGLSGAEVKARMIFRIIRHCSLKIWASTFFKTCLVKTTDEKQRTGYCLSHLQLHFITTMGIPMGN